MSDFKKGTCGQCIYHCFCPRTQKHFCVNSEKDDFEYIEHPYAKKFCCQFPSNKK